MRQGIDLTDRLIGTDALNPWEPQRITALVAGTGLNGVEGNFEDNLRLHEPHPPLLFNRMFEKILGVLGNLFVRQARVGLPDGCLLYTSDAADE